MVSIRLKRFGAKKRPYYRIVVMDSRSASTSRTIDELGTYHPIEGGEKEIKVDADNRQEDFQQAGDLSHTHEPELNPREVWLMEKELVEFLVRSLVDKPDEVSVNMVEGEKTRVLELHVAQDDIGKVIGKQGRIAKAIRTILSACATKDGKKASLEILD